MCSISIHILMVLAIFLGSQFNFLKSIGRDHGNTTNIGDTSASLSLAYLLYINDASSKNSYRLHIVYLLNLYRNLRFSTISVILTDYISFNNPSIFSFI